MLLGLHLSNVRSQQILSAANILLVNAGGSTWWLVGFESRSCVATRWETEQSLADFVTGLEEKRKGMI